MKSCVKSDTYGTTSSMHRLLPLNLPRSILRVMNIKKRAQKIDLATLVASNLVSAKLINYQSNAQEKDTGELL